jgi:hypothetical protein
MIYGWDLIQVKVIYDLISMIQYKMDAQGEQRTELLGSHGRCCKLHFSAYVASIWTWFFPTALKRWDVNILLTFDGGDGRHRAGNSGVLCLKLCVGEQRPCWGFGSHNRWASGSRPWGSSSGRWDGTGDSRAAGRQRGLSPMFISGLSKIEHEALLFIGSLLLILCRGRTLSRSVSYGIFNPSLVRFWEGIWGRFLSDS